MPDPYLSKDWNEGENIKINGPDRQLRMKMDNYRGGPRWHPFKNRMVKMKLREGADIIDGQQQPSSSSSKLTKTSSKKNILKKVLKIEDFLNQ